MLTVYVDLPILTDDDLGLFQNVATFKGPDKQTALAWVQEKWGADEEGRVNLLSVHEDGEAGDGNATG